MTFSFFNGNILSAFDQDRCLFCGYKLDLEKMNQTKYVCTQKLKLSDNIFGDNKIYKEKYIKEYAKNGGK